MSTTTKTKIVATLGPASNSVEIIKSLILAGMNSARINFSHGNYETHGNLIDKFKIAREELKLPVSLMLDTKGPEIRIGLFQKEKIYIAQGNLFTLTTKDIIGDEAKVSVSYKNLPNDLKIGSRVLIDDGLLEFKVVKITDEDIICEAINSGFLSSSKGVNVPGVYMNLPALTEKDIEDLKFGIKMGFDFIAASFVRKVDDVVKIKEILNKNNGSNIKIIAKIESRDGVDNIDSILEVADGIMVARGDLGVEIPPEEVPLVQKFLIKKANERGKTVITATQMLESMTNNLRPTRAEANDVANAILDGSDAIMLSGETAKGNYPVESVKMMSRIAQKTEGYVNYGAKKIAKYKNFCANTTNSISYAACSIAKELDVACIVTITDSGFTARMISRFRPHCPILAITGNESIYRQLSLVWGCLPVMVYDDKLKLSLNIDKSFNIAVEKSMEAELAKSGDAIVIAAGVPIGITGTTNTIKVQIVGGVLARGIGIGEKVVTGNICIIRVVEEAKKRFKDGDIIVTPKITDELLPFIKSSSGLVVGTWTSDESEKANELFKILGIPTIVCSDNVVDIIPNGIFAKLDSSKGFVYNLTNDKE